LIPCNYSANAAAITLAPSKGQLCGAKQGGDNNYSPKTSTPDFGGGKKKRSAKISSFTDDFAATILKSGE
jgi:hypothetical protein